MSDKNYVSFKFSDEEASLLFFMVGYAAGGMIRDEKVSWPLQQECVKFAGALKCRAVYSHQEKPHVSDKELK